MSGSVRRRRSSLLRRAALAALTIYALYSVALSYVPALLSDLTSLHLGGPVDEVVEARSAAEIVDAIAGAPASLLVLGGGSNLVAADAGWPGRMVLIRSRGIATHAAADAADVDAVDVTAAAGEPWDGLVEYTLAQGLSGLETMSGIPGLTGATPIQNVGAYGAEIADVLTALTVYDRQTGQTRRWAPAECGFAFRSSAFKHTDRFVILDVTMRLIRRSDSVPIRYAELARELTIEPGQSAPATEVRAAVLRLRRSKGMVADSDDHDSWSVGSFFVNPLLDVVPPAARDCPQWATDGRTKLSAAWLIEHAGFARGYGNERVSLSTKHTLALTNRGGATTADLLALAADIRAGVEATFGIRLRPEAHLADNIDWPL